MKKTAKIERYINHFCKYRFNANDIIEDKELYINKLFKKYKDKYNPDDHYFIEYPGEYLDWMANNLEVVLYEYKTDVDIQKKR
jgi:uridine kinase